MIITSSTVRESLAGRPGNHLLAALPDDTLTLLEPDLRQLNLPQGFVCCSAGDPIDQVYFPHTGMISQLVATGDGNMVETSSTGREGAVGLQCGLGPRSSFTHATVQTPGMFSAISAAHFEHVTTRSQTLRDLIFVYTEALWLEAQQNLLATPFTTDRRGCAAGCCSAPTGAAASNYY